MRFHVLGIPHTITNKDYNQCAFTQKVLNFCKFMTKLGHTVFHYGNETSKTDATENISVVSSELYDRFYGYMKNNKHLLPVYDTADEVYTTFLANAINEIQKRKQKNDFILPFWGNSCKPICDAHLDLICVEPGIGYGFGHFAEWKIFESYAIYHAYCGLSSVTKCKQKAYDVVIPNYFDLDDFEYKKQKDEYFLYIGRVYEGKGVHIAIQITEIIGKKLIIAGQGSLKEMGYNEIPIHVTEFGYASVNERKKLLSNAKAVFVISQYLEPFCGVQVEAFLSGTPVISSDWGAFSEYNLHNITGYRCRTFDDYIWAAQNIDRINPENCREWGENFSLENISLMYEEYFQNILNIYNDQGWYTRNYDKVGIHSMNRKIPQHPQLCIKNKKRVAIFQEKQMRLLYQTIIDNSSHLYNYEYIDWENVERSNDFLCRTWKYFDCIITSAEIFTPTFLDSYKINLLPLEFLDKSIIIENDLEVDFVKANIQKKCLKIFA